MTNYFIDQNGQYTVQDTGTVPDSATSCPQRPNSYYTFVNGVWTVNLNVFRAGLITALKIEALRRMNLIYGSNLFQDFAHVQLLKDILLSAQILVLQPNLSSLKAIHDAGLSAITTINGLNEAGLLAYNVQSSPNWP